MRILPVIMGFAAAISVLSPGLSRATPTGLDRALHQPTPRPLIEVQLRCDPSRCIDPRTGAYTQSGCDARGCYPISGIVGYTNPESLGYGSGYPYHRRWHRRYDE